MLQPTLQRPVLHRGPESMRGRCSGGFWGIFGLISHERDFITAAQQSKQVIFYLAWTAVFHLQSFQVCQSANPTLHSFRPDSVSRLSRVISHFHTTFLLHKLFRHPFAPGLLLESCRSGSQKYPVAMLTWIHAGMSAVIVKHGWLCVYGKVQSSDQHPPSHACDLAKWLHLISADRPIFGCAIIQVRHN